MPKKRSAITLYITVGIICLGCGVLLLYRPTRDEKYCREVLDAAIRHPQDVRIVQQLLGKKDIILRIDYGVSTSVNDKIEYFAVLREASIANQNERILSVTANKYGQVISYEIMEAPRLVTAI